MISFHTRFNNKYDIYVGTYTAVYGYIDSISKTFISSFTF